MLERAIPGSGLNEQEQAVGKVGNANNDDSQYSVEVPLPSKGLFYLGKNKNKTSIKIRPLDWRDEDILTTQQFIEDASVFNKILDNVILDEGVNSQTLVPVDRDTLLLWLRTQAFGSELDIVSNCPNCNHKITTKWDLTEVVIPSYEEDVERELEENGELKIVTPNSKLSIYITVPSIRDSEFLIQRLKKQSQTTSSTKLSTETLRLIVSGVQDPNDVEKVIRDKSEMFKIFDEKHLTIRDVRYIREQHERIAIAYNTEKTIKCSNCNYIQEGVSLPIAHKNFFWS